MSLCIGRTRCVDSGGAREWRPFFSTQELYEDFRGWLGRNKRERELSVVTFGRSLNGDLGLAWKRECPRDLWGKVPQGLHGKPGYWVGTIEEFRGNARRAAGLEVQGCRNATGNPEPGKPLQMPLSQGFQGSQGRSGAVAPSPENDAQGSSRSAA